MNKSNFRVIRGGKDPLSYDAYSFVKGLVTDTRLMGVVGLYLCFKQMLDEYVKPVYIHQLYYFDVEELGLDSIKIFTTEEEGLSPNTLKASFGGLGAEYVEVNEKEGRYLVNFFIKDSISKKLRLPAETSEIPYITKDCPDLTEEEEKALFKKMCTNIYNDAGAINYYLMRSFGRDFRGAQYLLDENADPVEDISMNSLGTFLRNKIVDYVDGDGNRSFLCESLVESDNGHSIVITEFTTTNDRKIASVRKKKAFGVSIQEASLLLAKDEYVVVFEVVSDIEKFDEDFAAYSVGCTCTEHESGNMYMEFNPNNLHVERELFRLDDDVKAVYYATDFGQLIVGCYDKKSLAEVEARLSAYSIAYDICPTGRFHFAQPVIYDFAMSEYSDFDSYVDSLV